MEVWPGRPYPLGATYDGAGTNFSLFSEVAEQVELCLFTSHGESSVEMEEVDGFNWHAYLPDVGPGMRYGYRVHGPYDPASGLRCNPDKLLIDPYAQALEGRLVWDDAVFGYPLSDPDGPPDTRDSAAYTPGSVVVNPWFDWRNDRQPRTPWHETVIYETHVKGMTQRHPDVPPELRGTYLGLAHPAVIDHLQRLGITAVELLPVHASVSEHELVERGLVNYWGYNSIAYLAPDNRFRSSDRVGAEVQEFKQMVRALHDAGIEVILDVVYNHTAEGNHLGPTLSFRGIDNPAYYRLVGEDPRFYMDYTGTGNSMNMRHPHVLQLIMDSLRYWVLEMHVDGFRFDLAATLARELHDVDRLSAFFDLIQQDPVISQVKLIAEPWDVGEGGYQVGNFPPGWSEWNGRYRDTVRDYWRGAEATLADFAYRFTGSSDLYAASTRRPFASVNFVTAHDGFTLRDLVSYDHKHNEANGFDNTDGTDDNRSWNCGEEGPTQDPEVLARRAKQQRNFLATVLLSQGVPMLLGGDEFGRSQGGNNNGFCQDNEISWFDWDAGDESLLEFTRQLIALRRDHPVFRRRRWFHGRAIRGQQSDIGWFQPDGTDMTDEDWGSGFAKSLGVFLNGDAIATKGNRGQRIVDDSFYVVFNAHHGALFFTLPAAAGGPVWEKLLDTSDLGPGTSRRTIKEGSRFRVQPRSLVVLRRVA
ncbi:MAG: glycogen debranching protein GlgX [Actinobacteria bacterium]|nr:glycogen debranching protein GlgX [Actinomycetota bacterium]